MSQLPPLDNDDLKFILGKPCFACAPIAWRLHELGLYNVERKAEAEQAAAIHWMLKLYLEHGPEKWREVAQETLRKTQPEPTPQP